MKPPLRRSLNLALVLVLLGSSAWCVRLIFNVSMQRSAVERRIVWQIEIQRIQTEVGELDIAATGTLDDIKRIRHGFAGLLAQLRSSGDVDEPVVVAANRAAAEIASLQTAVESGGRDLTSRARSETLSRLDALVAALQRSNARTSAQLGQHWASLIGISFGAILLSALALLLLFHTQRQAVSLERMRFQIEMQMKQREASQARLRISRERYALAAEGTDDGLWDWNLVLNRIHLSDHWKRQVGYEPSDIGTGPDEWFERVHPDDRAGLRDVLEGHKHDASERFEVEYRLLHRDGTYRWFIGRGQVVRGASGEPVRMVGAQMDITERVALSRIKREIISVVSHELRTPLTSILAPIGLLRRSKSELTEKHAVLLDLAEQSGRHLLEIIDQIRDFNSLLDRSLALDIVPLDLDQELSRIVSRVAATSNQPDVRFSTETVQPATVLADPERLDQAVGCLLANAVKFSPSGAEVRISTVSTPPTVRVEIADRGPGVPTEAQDRIFEPFRQGDSSNSRPYEGMGIGLTIARELVEQMGGAIGFREGETEGSVFWIELPLDT